MMRDWLGWIGALLSLTALLLMNGCASPMGTQINMTVNHADDAPYDVGAGKPWMDATGWHQK